VGGQRRFGVPPGGAFDQESLQLANALIGNVNDVSALEIGLGSLELRAEGEIWVSVVGAPAELVLEETAGQRINSSFRVPKGATLHIGFPSEGSRVYLGVPGGVVNYAEGLLQSRQTDRRPERRLAEGPSSLMSGVIRVVLGPHAETFGPSALEGFFQVGRLLDRRGIRLSGSPLPHATSIVSEPCTPGTIQVTNDGSLLIIGPDGPTIGGYPKLAYVISADLDRVGQLRPDDEVLVEVVSVEEARAASFAASEKLQRLVRNLQLATR